MNNFRLMKRLKGSYLVRCKYWVVCNSKHCDHYDPHNVRECCMMLSPVKYCRVVKGFVHDIPIEDIDSNYQSNPNLAFKAKREDDNRRKNQRYGRDYPYNRRDDTDERF